MKNQNTSPFQMHLEQDKQGRICRKIEYVTGRDPRIRNYEYDDDGQLTAVSDENRETESYEYDGNGHRIAATWYEPEVESQKLVYQEHYSGDTRLCAINNRSVYHDDNGFRESWYPHSGEEHYEYAPDYRLLKITKEGPDGQPMTIEFDHDQNGQRCEKYENGQLVELYDWHDLIRLASAKSHGQELEFHYRDGERTPAACTYNGEHLLYLYYDQVGSLRVVADEYGNVVKEVRYTAFGVIEEDTNPGLFMPIGFAGGLHDRDIKWVRFGYRDYDPLTARFTAKDPMGYAAGDSDLRGYCFDDPVNRADPTGLFAPVVLFGAAKLGSLGIAALGSYMAAGAADAAGRATDDNYGNDGKTAVQGMNEVAPKVAAIHAGTSVVAPAPAAFKLLPQAASIAAPHANKIAKAGKDFAQKGAKMAGNAFKNGMIKTAKGTYRAERAAENEFMSKPDYYTKLANDALNPNPPAATGVGSLYNAAKTAEEQYELGKGKGYGNENKNKGKAKPDSNSWWGR